MGDKKPIKKAKKKAAQKSSKKKVARNVRKNDISSEGGIERAFQGTGPKTKFQFDFCDLLIDHMKAGHSFDTFSVKVQVAPGTLHNWVNNYEDFANAKKVGEKHRQFLLEKIGLKLAAKGGGSAAAWIFTMKNVEGWADQLEITEKIPDDPDGSLRDKRLARIKELEEKRRLRDEG